MLVISLLSDSTPISDEEVINNWVMQSASWRTFGSTDEHKPALWNNQLLCLRDINDEFIPRGRDAYATPKLRDIPQCEP